MTVLFIDSVFETQELFSWSKSSLVRPALIGERSLNLHLPRALYYERDFRTMRSKLSPESREQIIIG